MAQLREPNTKQLGSPIDAMDMVVRSTLKTDQVNREEPKKIPCSPNQHRLWLLQQLDCSHPALTVSARWQLNTSLSSSDLRGCVNIIFARHPGLRSCFVINGEQVEQRFFLDSNIVPPISDPDLSALSTTQALLETERLARRDACSPFDLSDSPLLRFTRFRLDENVSVVLVTIHRMIADKASIDILMAEFNQLCTALSVQKSPYLPGVSTSDNGLSALEALRSKTKKQQAAIDFWRNNLRSYNYFSLDTDNPRPAKMTKNGSSVSIPLNKELIRRLNHVRLQNSTTLHITVNTALLILLHRYSGETDIAIGIQFNGRDDKFSDLTRSYSNDVVLRGDLSDDPSFLTLLRRTCRKLDEIYQHQHIALQQLIDIAQSQSDLSRHPLFSILFQYYTADRYESPTALVGGNPFSLLTFPACCEPTTDLQFSLYENSQGWQLVCEFNADLYETQTVHDLIVRLQTMLQHVSVDPAEKISRLNMLNVNESQQLNKAYNSSDVIYPHHLTLPELFGVQALRTSKALAVVGAEYSLSYNQLDLAANRLARVLQSRGIKPGDRVAVLLRRTPELVVALLAVLKSGAAYIPLDPSYPLARLQQVFESAEPNAIITQLSLIDCLSRDRSTQHTSSAIILDAESKIIRAQNSEPLPVLAFPDNPAYIIYTSGSTGTPKGVVISHRAVVNFLYAMRQQPGIREQDRLLAVTTIAFDIAVLELFLPLICGAHLVLASEQEVVDGSALLNLLRRHHITFMQATPVTWRLLLNSGFKGKGWTGQPALKMLCGGEILDRTLAEQLMAGGGELWNMYGPTETTVWSSVLRVESGQGPVQIGPPIANTQFYILDQGGELLPKGVPGELYIGGDGVAQGYVALPTVTAEKFIPDCFSKKPGARLYRTGDRVRQRENGCLEYLGRTDNQIKLRGFRIELGEIDTVLLGHSDTAEAVAVLGKDSSGEAAILAYVVARSDAVLTDDELIDELKVQVAHVLPVYMRPSAIVVLEALPRTPNGKIDRQALRAPLMTTSQSKYKRQATPELFTVIESRLAKLWQTVLDREKIDKHANFFDAGGHSLHAAHLLTAIEAEFGQRLNLLMLFEAPTIAEQARLLNGKNGREFDFRQVVRLRTQGSKPPLIAIHNTGIFFYKLAKHLGVDQPVTSLQLFDPALNRQTFPQTLEEIAAEYVELIQSIHPKGPYQLIGWCVGGVLAFEIARQLNAASHEVSLLTMIDTWAPGHRQRLPWLQAKLADYSFRWQLIGADWRRVLNREKTFTAFLSQRVTLHRLLAWVKNSLGKQSPQAAGQPTQTDAEIYDQWLLDYLDNAAQHYIPKIYPGKLTLLCSAQEPHGLFLDPKMGWGAFTKAGIDLAEIEGDHFTVFDGRGLEQIAGYIVAANVPLGISSGISSDSIMDQQYSASAYVTERKRKADTDTVCPVAK